MIELLEFKKLLGSLAEELSEEEILKVREQQDKEAEIYFNMWLENIKINKKEV